MSNDANRILEGLDSLAKMTGVPDLDRRMSQALKAEVIRPFRIASAVLLVSVLVGFVLMTGEPLIKGFGSFLILGCYVASGIIRMFSPMRSFARPRDEFEKGLQTLGRVWGLASVAILSVGGCFWFGVATYLVEEGFKLWMPRDAFEWFIVGLTLVVIGMNVSILAASWALPESEAEIDCV
jgi:hypothetical protein